MASVQIMLHHSLPYGQIYPRKDRGQSATCVVRDLNGPTAPIVNNITFQTLIIIIAGACTAIAGILYLAWILNHALHCTRLSQQKYITRILVTPACFAIFGLCAIVSYPAAIYLNPIPKLIESVSTCALFQLYVLTVSSENRHERDFFFMNLPHQKKAGGPLLDNNGSLHYFRATCFKVFQFPVVSLIVTIIQMVTAAILCSTGTPAKAARIITTIVLSISTLTAALAIIRFYQRLKAELQPIGGLRKLVVLKALIGVVIFQALVMTIVISAGAVHPTSTINLADFATGLPGFLTCCEMFIFAPFFLWAYNVGPYKTASRSEHQNLLYDQTHLTSKLGRKFSPILVIWQAINITDLLDEILYAFKDRFAANSNLVRHSAEELHRTPPYRKQSSSDTSVDQGLPVPLSGPYHAYGQTEYSSSSPLQYPVSNQPQQHGGGSSRG